MFPHRPSRRSGVALVITVVMLSVITFLTVAFLALMGREKGSVKTAVDQSTARLAADTALERAKAELLASILASTNLNKFDLLVSTNFVNWNGFDATGPVFDQFTNVNYEYRNAAGQPALTPLQAQQNLTNLLINPRPPVFITNRMAANSLDFRYYIDLNRNRRPDRTGLWPETNALGLPVMVLSNSVLVTNFSYNTGDPEWIGGLDRADKPHGPDNKFLNRYAYIVVPVGKTLDVNYIHNNAMQPGNQVNGFLRNQGMGSWELNFAGFLADLNTNYWNSTAFALYNYDTNGLTTGTAFDDAYAFWQWRRGGVNQLSVQDMYGNAGAAAFRTDLADGYSSGPLLNDTRGFFVDPDFVPDRTDDPWSGADLPNHFFSMQDFFDPTKTAVGVPGFNFTDRLSRAGTNVSTYDQYTFSRLISQLGTDSAPEEPGKLHLNYKNVDGLSATNFVAWTNATEFFTNVANQLLLAYTEDWLAKDYAYYTNRFQITTSFGVTNIPVFVNGRMVYSSSVQRVLQLAANIWDAKTNAFDLRGPLPTVFQPLFVTSGANVFISGYRRVETVENLQGLPGRMPTELTRFPNAATSLPFNELLYGVPLVIGATKGLPNFNEFASESVITITRKVQLIKDAPGGQSAIRYTNQVYDMSVAINSGAEFWNSYRSNYNRPVRILVNNVVSYALTNDWPNLPYPSVRNSKTNSAFVNIGVMWSGWTNGYTNSFVVPLRTNVNLFNPATVSYLPGSATFTLPNTSLYDNNQNLIFPLWVLTVTNQVQAIISDQDTGRIIDYVLLGDMTAQVDIGALLGRSRIPSVPGDSDATVLADQIWATNTLPSGLTTGRDGVYQQIRVSRGSYPAAGNSFWTGEGSFTGNRPAEIAKFLAFFTPNGVANYSEGGVLYPGVNQALVAYTPFNPTRKLVVPMTWQANDPLVHYTARDMLYVEGAGNVETLRPPNNYSNYIGMKDIGTLNKRYKPWGHAQGVPHVHELSLKDPLVQSSDDWAFPTNSLPTIGWLGRIHRGSPWQTVYLKSSDVGIVPQASGAVANNGGNWATSFTDAANRWAGWSGNQDLQEGFWTRPVSDRVLFDVLTAAPNDNATRGRLSVNQTGMAAWSALFSGLVVLSNANTDAELNVKAPLRYEPLVINPVGQYDSFNMSTWPPLLKIIAGIEAERSRTNTAGQFIHPAGYFERAADVLSTPELSVASPYLRTNSASRLQRGLSDAAYEWLPQQVLPLLQLGQPRFVIYAYGQSLQPAPDSIITAGGNFFGLCTNYTITAEVAMRAVVRVEGSPNPNDVNHPNLKMRYPPRIVTESFNFLPPE